MEARISRVGEHKLANVNPKLYIFTVVLLSSLICDSLFAQQLYQAESTNFVVRAPDAGLAQVIARKAEVYRKDLSIEWLGYEIPQWQERCPIQVELAMHAGGETSFAFVGSERGKGTPISWQMRIFGPPNRLIDAVLPHEVTHTIFATHFGRPLPRWADEGACTTVEHSSEREKNHRMLIDFLTSKPSRGIPFNRMFVMREYPQDILPLYAQGYSLAKFLINQKGKRQFIEYVGAGLKAEHPGREISAWDQATNEFYGFENLSELQLDWLAWVKKGCRDDDAPATYAIAKNGTESSRPTKQTPADIDQSWYERQSQINSNERFSANRQALPSAQTELKHVKRNRNSLHLPPGLRSKTIWR